MSLCTRTSGEAEGRRAQAWPPRRPEEALLRRNPPPEAGGKLPESSTRRAVRALPARPMPTAVPERPGPRSPSPPSPPRSPRPALEERRAVTVSAHSSRSPRGNPAAGSAQTHTFPKPRPLTSCPWDLRAPFGPALVRASPFPQSQSGPWPVAVVRTVAPSRPRVDGGG